MTRSDSAGLLVLGMHRSGTSALARLLHDAGADVGERVVAASAGNEGGHWEDAFAVETDDRLLSALGRRWDDPRPLPGGWRQSAPAREARALIRGYVAGSRAAHPVWAVKDPRMCLFADLWVDALDGSGCRASAILLARHPQEVMASLAARDGMPPARAALLWMHYMLHAERATRGLPRVFATYDMLLREPVRLLERIRALPGASALRADPAAIEALDAAARHHRAHDAPLQSPLDALWPLFEKAADAGQMDRAALDRVASGLEQADRIYASLLDEVGQEHAALWERTARAESMLAGETAGVPQLNEGIAALGDSVVSLDARLADAVGVELRRMQEEHARALASASGLASQVGMAKEIAPGLAQLRESVTSLDARLADAVGVELRRMQEEHAQALASASGLASQVGMAKEIAPGLAQLRESVASLDARLADAVGVELRRMQEEHALAVAQASALAAEAALARQLAPEMQRLHQEGVEYVATIAGLRAELVERDSQLADRDSQLADRESQLADRESQLADRESQLADRDSQLADRESQLAASREALLDLQRRLPPLQADSELLRQVVGSRSWRLTRPLRGIARIFRGEALQPGLRGWLALRLASLPFLPREYRTRKLLEGRGSFAITREAEGGGQTVEAAPAAPELAPPGDKPDVLVWSVIDWHFRTQRPQHIARGMAEAGHRVFYVSNNLVDSPEPGFRVEPLDGSGRLYQIFLHAEGAPAIYYAAPSPQVEAQLRRSIGELAEWADVGNALCIVQHPFWTDIASRVPGATLIYDCMDHHAGFEDNASDVLAAEAELARSADLLVVTSEWLDHEMARMNPHRAVVRNAGDFEHFNRPPEACYVAPRGRKVLGYFGAIAEWFDVELVRGLARAQPDCIVLLVGSDTAGAAAQLSGESNIEFTGEVPYDRLPFYLHAFDVALLPFKVIPLTLATNPVKVYEYLSAGKPVVSVDLPEMRQFGDLVRRASDSGAFLSAIGAALREDDPDMAERRRAFAREQTWIHRAGELDAALGALRRPLVSVVVLAYNNLDFTRACLHSIETLSDWPDLEVIVVDNASTDGTRAFLAEWEAGGAGRRAILNDDNLGFAAGNNVGLAAARGDYLILLNNDTYVTPGWVATMVRHLARNPDIGLLGPVTNNIGNEARIEIQYADMDGMRRNAAMYTRRHMGELFDIHTAAFFCVAMPRSTYELVGGLDEAFGIGFFEDDDYCRRVQAAGLRVACAEDVFIHHHLSASFDALKAERKKELFERNKAIYEAKWGAWVPHAYRRR